MYILYLVLAVLILLFMVMIHELGHYVAGKMLGFKINEFSIGFGKSIFSKTNKKTGEVFSLRVVPLGGYCAFEGEDSESDNSRAFNKQAPWKRIIVLFFGAFFNLISAVIFSIILLVSAGYDVPQIYDISSVPKVTSTVILPTDNIIAIDGKIVSDSKAENIATTLKEYDSKENYSVLFSRNGQILEDVITVYYGTNEGILVNGDVITHVNDVKIDFIQNNLITDLLEKVEGDTVRLTVKRNGEVIVLDNVNMLETGIASSSAFKKTLGVQLEAYKFTLGEALARCIPFTFGLAFKVLEVLWLLISGQLGLAAIGGPITTITTIATFTQSNFSSFFVLLPLIAVNLGVFNLLPIPALDGSKMVFTTIEWIRGKPIKPELENKIHTIGLFLLFALVIIADLYHLFI